MMLSVRQVDFHERDADPINISVLMAVHGNVVSKRLY